MVGGMNAPQPMPRPATYQDVLDAPPHMIAQIVHGALHLQPRPAFPHSQAHSALQAEIASAFGRRRGGPAGPGGWRILFEPELHLGEEVLVPDVAGWRRERMPALPATAWSDVVPDWVCEVLSPSTWRFDLTAKREVYAEVGVPHLWIVNPVARTLESFALREGSWVLAAALSGGDPVRLAPFEAVEWPLSELWDEEPPAGT